MNVYERLEELIGLCDRPRLRIDCIVKTMRWKRTCVLAQNAQGGSSLDTLYGQDINLFRWRSRWYKVTRWSHRGLDFCGWCPCFFKKKNNFFSFFLFFFGDLEITVTCNKLSTKSLRPTGGVDLPVY